MVKRTTNLSLTGFKIQRSDFGNCNAQTDSYLDVFLTALNSPSLLRLRHRVKESLIYFRISVLSYKTKSQAFGGFFPILEMFKDQMQKYKIV